MPYRWIRCDMPGCIRKKHASVASSEFTTEAQKVFPLASYNLCAVHYHSAKTYGDPTFRKRRSTTKLGRHFRERPAKG